MKAIYRLLIVVLGLGVVVTALTLLDERPVHAQAPPQGVNVNVLNTLLPVDGDAAREPFQVTLCTAGWPPGCGVLSSNFTVPPDKRLVIESISGGCNTADLSETLTNAQVATVAGGSANAHHVVPQFVGATTGAKLYRLAQLTRLYADPGTLVDASAGGFPVGNSGCLITISGYHVNP